MKAFFLAILLCCLQVAAAQTTKSIKVHIGPLDFKGVEIGSVKLQNDLWSRVSTEIVDELKRRGATDSRAGGTRFEGIVIWLDPVRDSRGRVQFATGVEVHIWSLGKSFKTQTEFVNANGKTTLLYLAKAVANQVAIDLEPQVPGHLERLAEIDKKLGKK